MRRLLNGVRRRSIGGILGSAIGSVGSAGGIVGTTFGGVGSTGGRIEPISTGGRIFVLACPELGQLGAELLEAAPCHHCHLVLAWTSLPACGRR